MTTEIKPCTCTHKFQDERYGKGQRVHNPVKSTKKAGVNWRCTVCGKEKG